MNNPTLTRCLGALAAFGFSMTLHAADYYVAASGSNSGDGSRGKPWKTVQHAADQASAGDVILVAPGEYPEYVKVKASGQEKAPIHFKSHEPHGAKLQGFNLLGDYIIIEGFDITHNNGVTPGIDAGEAHRDTARKGCQMIGNLIHDLDWTGINTGEQAIVRDNVIRNIGRGIFANSGTLVERNEVDTLVPQSETKNGKERLKKTQYCFFAGEDIVFRNNYLHGTKEEYLIKGMGVDFFVTWDQWIIGTSKNILIEGNRCFNATHASESDCTKLKESSHFTYRNNLFVNTVYVGIYNKYVKHMTIENNTFVNCGAYPIWFQSAPETEGTIVRNNIIAYHNRDRVVKEFGWKAADAGIRNNLYPGKPVTTSNNLMWKTQNREYSSSDFVADPMFVDPDNHDYRLRAGSPAIDAGVTIPEIETDLVGTQRPVGGGYDIGAYEFKN